MKIFRWQMRGIQHVNALFRSHSTAVCSMYSEHLVRCQKRPLCSPRSLLTTSVQTLHGYVPFAVSEISRRSPPLPVFITQKLRSIQCEIMKILVEKTDCNGALASCFSNATFTESFQEMAKYYFDQGGKLFRPTVCLLMARACNQLKPHFSSVDAGRDTVTEKQHKIAVISEMIHTASLVHDDVIDEASIRRGHPTVHSLWGNKMAVLVGDYILARATQVLCSIGRPGVISVMATIIEDLVKGEFMQMTEGAELNGAERFERYMAKTFSKTASLFANSCRSVAMLSDISEAAQLAAYEYGKALGLAFQMADDLLDFISTSSATGKPVANDLKLGLATAPVLFAAEEYPELNALIDRHFSEEGDFQEALEIIGNSRGLERTRAAVRNHSQQAVHMIFEKKRKPHNMSSDGISDRWNQTKREAKNEVAGENKCGFENTVYANKFPNEEGIRDQLVRLAMAQVDRDR